MVSAPGRRRQRGGARGTGAPPREPPRRPRRLRCRAFERGGPPPICPRLDHHLNGAKYQELQPQVIEIETNVAFFSQKSEVVLGGRKAEYRIVDKQPQFYSYFAPTEALLVKLKPGDSKNDRNLKMGSGGYHPFGGSSRQGVRSEDRIAVKSEREANGFYRITPATPLPAGEYAFIVLSGTSAGGRMFDFGVD
jgi:hypothetical protein